MLSFTGFALIIKAMKDELIYHGMIFDIVSFEPVINGHTHHYEVLRHHGGVGLLCVQDDSVLLVKQMRYAIGQETLEIPAGKLEKGEDALEAGLRELNEEAGYECEKTKLVCAFYPTPGYSDEKIWIYECLGLHAAKNKLPQDQDENVRPFWMPLAKARKAIADGRIVDGKTIIAIQHALLQERND